MSHIQQIFHFSKVNKNSSFRENSSHFFLFSHTILNVNRSLLQAVIQFPVSIPRGGAHNIFRIMLRNLRYDDVMIV